MNTVATTADQVRPTRARVGLAIILFVTLLVSYLDRVNVSVLVADKTFLTDMGIAGQPIKMGLLMSSFLFAYGISNLLVGPVGNWLGPRKAMSLSIVLWGVSTAVGGLAGSFGAMLAARVLLGIGEGMHWPMQSTFVKNWFPPNERAKANSAWILGIMVGPMISMPLISSLVHNYGWRASFAFLIAISLVPLALVWFFSSDHPRQSRFINCTELDYIESALKAEQNAQVATPSGVDRAAPRFFRDIRFWLITVAYLCSSSMFWGTMAWLPSYLKVARNFSWAQMGALSSLPYVLGAVTVVIFGIIADRTVRKGIFPTIALIGAASCIYLGANATENIASAYFLSGAIGFIGVGLASYWTIMQNIVRRDEVGLAAGIMNGVASFGSAFIPAAVGYLIELSGGNYTSGLMFLVSVGSLGGLCSAVLTLRKS